MMKKKRDQPTPTIQSDVQTGPQPVELTLPPPMIDSSATVQIADQQEKRHYIKPQTCRNCGINGHLYKDCIHPIMSFGIICYKVDADGKIRYLMIQRKDSLSFMEFIRGKYNINDILYIRQLVSAMTLNEKNLLLKKQFDDIWNYVWNQGAAANIKHTTEYIESKYKFEYLNNSNILANIINNVVHVVDQEQEWGFPKGRRKLKETEIDCALREFCEETRLTAADIQIIDGILPFEEIFFGTNNVLYKHTYYVAKVKNNDIPIAIDQSCIEQVREVRALNWFCYDEVLQHIKLYNIERHQIIQKTHKIISHYEKLNI
jgi:8-oxo-dGTP pyrophosphatase MutT (NUDIX family)